MNPSSASVSPACTRISTPSGSSSPRRSSALVRGTACVLLSATLSGCNTTGGAQLASDVVFGVVGTGVGLAVSSATGDTGAGVAAGAGVFALSRLTGASRLFYSNQLKFQEAVLRGDTVRVAKYADAKYIDKPIEGMPPVFHAAINNDIQMLQLLVRRGASLRGRYNGRSLAFLVASYGQRATANEIVRMGGAPQRDVSDGWALYVEHRRQQEEYRRMQQRIALQGIMLQLQSMDYRDEQYQEDAGRYGGISDQQRAAMEQEYRRERQQRDDYRRQNMPYYGN